MLNLPATLLALSLLLPAGAFAQTPPPNPSFNLVNRGTAAVKEFFATPGGRTTWGRDRLDGKGLAPGAKFAIRLPADGNCKYDLRAVFADGRTEDRRDLNTCTSDDIAVGEATPAAPAVGSTPAATAKSFRLFNRGTVAITELGARPQGVDKWSVNRLAAGPIPPGGDRSFALPPGGQCIFDLRVTFEGGKSREKSAADLCKSPEQGVQ